MSLKKLLIANRGEIAIRIARAANEMGIETVAIYAADDANSLHVKSADEAVALNGSGAAAYLDQEQVIAAARQTGCDAVHPGYGFLSENADFARACEAAGLTFVGPRPDALDLFGDKVRARSLAEESGVPLLPGTNGATSLADARAFMEGLGNGAAVMIKAVSGGGGRGMRPVSRPEDMEEAYARCQSEAKAAFGNDAVYVEQLIQRARHIEVQIVGDGETVIDLGERECSLQRRNQKLVEIAPSPTLAGGLRTKITNAAIKLAQAAAYDNIGTFEFLVDATDESDDALFAFMEANPRLQVEHTVTEEVTGIDLVKTQLRIAAGEKLASLGLDRTPAPRGYAIQLRINMETMDAKGDTLPSGGKLTSFTPPSGPGIRVDTFGYAGYVTSPNYDSLLAKLIAYSPSPDYSEAVTRAYRALSEFDIGGVATNLALHQNLLTMEAFRTNAVHTTFIAENIGALTEGNAHPNRRASDGAGTGTTEQAATIEAPAGTIALPAHLQGRVVSINVNAGDTIAPGQQVAVLEAMKMEHIVEAHAGGVVREVIASPDDTIFEGHPLLFFEERDVETGNVADEQKQDLDYIRPDLAEVIERHGYGLDENRPEAVERRRNRGQRTARENIAQLCDENSFIEYGALAVAAQRRRRGIDDLIRSTPADGLITGVGAINGDLFGEEASRAAVMAYDATVLAGTQGSMNHKKTDRILHIAQKSKLPFILFAEGGGGRPGDTDVMGVAGLDVTSFEEFARLSGDVPLIGIVSGRCFAGNAALLGCSDVIIATRNSNIGMGGPAMIEGGGLGVYKPEDIGPIDVQTKNGVVDIAVEDEQEAVAVAKKYLSYFQGAVKEWDAVDQRTLRQLIPENRLRAYDVRTVINALCDTGSVLELRKDFGIGILTCLVRIEGRPMGLIANNPFHLGGAIDADAADKSARFLQLCDAFGLPILSLCDTPGFMVGPEVEKTAQVRHVSRLFVTAASLSVPFFTVVLRKGYGLGAQGMTGGTFHAPFFNIAWPTGEFGGMGLEGAVRLGFKREMDAIEDPDEREKFYQQKVADSYTRGKAMNMASYLEIDGVIDPADTRHWIMRGMKSQPPRVTPTSSRGFIDTW